MNGFHVLFEDSFRELEYRQAPRLRTCLEQILQHGRQAVKASTLPSVQTAAAWRQVQLAIGPAMRLLSSSPDLFDADDRKEIERQVVLIRAADGEELPSWLGPASRTLLTIDYRRFRPTGFYADSYYLADYFRAVRWLQVVPFPTQSSWDWFCSAGRQRERWIQRCAGSLTPIPDGWAQPKNGISAQWPPGLTEVIRDMS